MADIGLVGCGRWGCLILRDLVSISANVHVVARSVATTEKARGSGAKSCNPDLKSLHVHGPSLAGFIVATPSSTHASVALSVISLFEKIPVFIEKPIATSEGEAEELADKGEGRLFVMDKWRYHPAIERLQQAAFTEEFGRLLGVATVRVQSGNPHTDVPAIWTYMPHDLAIIREILGEIPMLRTAFGTPDGEAIHATFGFEPWASIDVSARAPSKRRSITAHFEHASATLDDPEGDIRVVWNAEHGGRVATMEVVKEQPLLRELRAFVLYATGEGVPPKTDAAGGLKVVRAIAAARRMASSK